VVIAHDFLETWGGAERVTREMALAFPEAPVVTILGRPSIARLMGIEDRYRSVLPARRGLLRHYRALTPVFPAIVARARVPEADVLLSSSYAFAHRFRTPNGAPQVCYCHSPLRFAWTMTESYRGSWAPSRPAAIAFEVLAGAMRRSDRRSSRGVDRYLTQSPYTAEQIERFYGRRAEIVEPPVDCELFHPGDRSGPGDYFLLCGRLIEPYLRAEVAIEAFRRLPHRLVIAGDGPAAADLRAAAPPNVTFVGRVPDAELVGLMQGCAALLSPTRHDYGLLPIEAMACGRPVLAYGEGGVRYTVVPGVTGELFDSQSPDAVAEAVSRFRPEDYDPARIREHAERWDRRRFRRRIVEIVRATAATPRA
jgi:glycosyltransferase involved in cell wall biosynthesis